MIETGLVYLSRFTPGLVNGADVSFKKGETVTYLLSSGKTVSITIDSEVMKHQQAPGELGYECIFHDDGQRAFAVSSRIVGWEGKR